MRLTQAAIVAILAFTVASKPIEARQDVQSTNEYKAHPDPYPAKCYDGYGKEKTCDDEKDKDPKVCHDSYGKEIKCEEQEVPKPQPDPGKCKQEDLGRTC